MTEWTPQGEHEARAPLSPPPLYPHAHDAPPQAIYPGAIQPFIGTFPGGGPGKTSRLDWLLRFIIVAGAAFAVISVTQNDGDPPRDRVFIDLPVVEPAGAVGALPLDTAEEFVAAYEPQRDGRGSYVESGQEITRAFGAELVWADLNVPDPTTRCREGADSPDEVLAWYCSAEPYLIRLNRGSPAMPSALYDKSFVDSVRHELAHLVIHARCGDSQPAARTVELEGVTSSYAVLFLGADREELGSLGSEYPAYSMTTRTDDVARWIRADVCWYETGGTAQ
ncbi:MAG: hypothetical protein HGA51_07205 [Demequinaceae bacterium]|nr:hypothetical protein [Demequinaceae bacterium]